VPWSAVPRDTLQVITACWAQPPDARSAIMKPGRTRKRRKISTKEAYAMDFVLHRFPCLSKSIKYPLEEQDAQADDHQRDAGGGSYSQDLVHPYLRLEAPTP
jgi:hypothetical protein